MMASRRISSNLLGQLADNRKDDSRKRKLENPNEGDDAKVEVSKTSLGLSSLQSYNENLLDGYRTADEKSVVPKNIATINFSVPSKNIFVEEIIYEDEADENLVEMISPLNTNKVDDTQLLNDERNNLSASELKLSSTSDKNFVLAAGKRAFITENIENVPSSSEQIIESQLSLRNINSQLNSKPVSTDKVVEPIDSVVLDFHDLRALCIKKNENVDLAVAELLNSDINDLKDEDINIKNGEEMKHRSSDVISVDEYTVEDSDIKAVEEVVNQYQDVDITKEIKCKIPSSNLAEKVQDQNQVVHTVVELNVENLIEEVTAIDTLAYSLIEKLPTSMKSPKTNVMSDKVATFSDAGTFKDTMDTLEQDSDIVKLEKSVYILKQQSFESEESSLLINEESVKDGSTAEPPTSNVINMVESGSDYKVLDLKSELVDESMFYQGLADLQKITPECMKLVVEESPDTNSHISTEMPLKLQQALKSINKKEETIATVGPSQLKIGETDESRPEIPPKEPPIVNENSKLHLSVQSNHVSIKKNVVVDTSLASAPAPTPAPVVDVEPPPRIKRPYRKRPKPTTDPVLLTEKKSYILRSRSTKYLPVEVTAKKPRCRRSTTTAIASVASAVAAPPVFSSPVKEDRISHELLPPSSPLPPITIEIDPPLDKNITSPIGKVRPTKLKLNNPVDTIECPSKYRPVTIENINGPEIGPVPEKIVRILEGTCKKESQTSVCMELPAWSETDLQRVERLLKESNITITPIHSASSFLSAELVSPSSPSILEPILTAAKEKSSQKSACKRPPALPPFSCSAVGAANITPVLTDCLREELSVEPQLPLSHNLNMSIKQFDFEEQLSFRKTAKSCHKMEALLVVEQRQQHSHVNVKSEIRKKIAPFKHRKPQLIHRPELNVMLGSKSRSEEVSLRPRAKTEIISKVKPTIIKTRRKLRSRAKNVMVIKSKLKASEIVDEKVTRNLRSNIDVKGEIITSKPPSDLRMRDKSKHNVKNIVFDSKSDTKVVSELKFENEEIAKMPELEIIELQPETGIVTEKTAIESAPEAEHTKVVSESMSEKVTRKLKIEISDIEANIPSEKSSFTVLEKSNTVVSEEFYSVAKIPREVESTIIKPQPELSVKIKRIVPDTLSDLLPISVPVVESRSPAALKSIHVVSVPSPTVSISSQLAFPSSQGTSSKFQDKLAIQQTVSTLPQPTFSAQQMPSIKSQFVPLVPQITPLLPKMPETALATPQFTPGPQMSSATSSVMSSVASSMLSVSMTSSNLSVIVDDCVNSSSTMFTDTVRLPNSTLSPLMFPKKRGRPSKAMVAARESYRQSREAFEIVKKQPFKSIPLSVDGSIPQPTPPISTIDESSLFPDVLKIKYGTKPKLEEMDKSNGRDDTSLAEKLAMDLENEVEASNRLEEDRIRTKQERERKNEIRRLKVKDRNDLEKAKKMRQRLKAKEHCKIVQEQRRLMQEKKKKLVEIRNLPGFDAEKVNGEDVSQMSNYSFGIDDDSSSNTFDSMQRIKKAKMEVYVPDRTDMMVEQIAEYQWPIHGKELYMIQEQISNFLGVKSFKRKYPDIKRRPVDSEERAYLVDSGFVSETLCNLGITAVCSAEILDIMCFDFPEKYEELRKYMREKQMKELSFKQKAWVSGLGYKLLMADGSKQDLKKCTMESVCNWNSALNKSRRDDRPSTLDLQTFIIHYPKSRTQNMSVPSPKIGCYPVSILPGQFCDFYKEYTSTELRYMPLNTVMYGPLKHPSAAQFSDRSKTDSDDNSSSDDSSSATSEDTQTTEDTAEDMYKNMSLDESLLIEKLSDGTSARKDRDTGRPSNSVTDSSSQEDGKVLCKICLGDEKHNKENVPEVLIYCSRCCFSSHRTCLNLSLCMVRRIKSYKWQCPDCNNCARCKEHADKDKMLFCDNCDRGFHIYCVGLRKVPSDNWQCQKCTTVDVQLNRKNLSAPCMPSTISIKIES